MRKSIAYVKKILKIVEIRKCKTSILSKNDKIVCSFPNKRVLLTREIQTIHSNYE